MEKNYKEIAKEISFNALKKGNASVRKFDYAVDGGFDIECIEESGKTMIGVKATSETDNFYITCNELLAMQTSNYLIHRYKFHKDKIKEYNIYTYDKENNILVDITNSKNICTIESKVVNKNGTVVIQHECVPKKLKKRNI